MGWRKLQADDRVVPSSEHQHCRTREHCPRQWPPSHGYFVLFCFLYSSLRVGVLYLVWLLTSGLTGMVKPASIAQKIIEAHKLTRPGKATAHDCSIKPEDPKKKMMSQVFKIVLVFAIALAAGAQADRIVGGTAAGSSGKIPYIVNLRHALGFQFCAGSVYNYNYILTAAHCGVVTNDYIVAGDYDKSDNSDDNEQIGNIVSVNTHSDYGSVTNKNDICLLTLSSSLTANNYVQTITLPTVAPAADAPVTISGWGTTSAGGSSSNVLLYATVAVISDNVCTYDYGNSIKPGMICIGVQAGGTDTCQGDSGGPAVLKMTSGEYDTTGPYTQVGITSWGYGCADAGAPGVYTSVAYFRQWVLTNTQ